MSAPVGTNSFASLVYNSIEYESAAAPVDREVILIAAGCSIVTLLAAAFGRFWAMGIGTGGVVGDVAIRWGQDWAQTLSTPAGVVAFTGLAFDCGLAGGRAAGEWARWLTIAQMFLVVSAIPALTIGVVFVLNVVVFVALVIVAIVLGLLVALALVDA